jgi:hypothetical protein
MQARQHFNESAKPSMAAAKPAAPAPVKIVEHIMGTMRLQ